MSQASEPVTDPGPQPQAGHEENPDRSAWRRLDRRMLLVHPVTELVRFLPALIAFFVIGPGRGDDGPDAGLPNWIWQLGAVVVIVGVGFLRYLTTTYQVSAEHVSLRKGLLSRHVLTARRDTVRTVDLTSPPIHRVLGLAKVVIGTGEATGVSNKSLELDSLGAAAATRLRDELLLERAARSGPAALDVDDATGAEPPPAPRTIVSFEPSWVRFAPFTTGGLVVAAAVIGFVSQVVDRIMGDIVDSVLGRVDDFSFPWPLLIAVGAIVIAVLLAVFSVIGYLLANWGLTVTHDAGAATYHRRRGLLTTRETSIDDNRIRGVELGEPLGLRLARGGRLNVIVTGLTGGDSSRSTLVPPAPIDVVRAAGDAVLGTDEPLSVGLTPHGPAARRRLWTRGLLSAAFDAVVIVAVVLWFGVPKAYLLLAAIPLVAAPLLARDRYAALGHALTPRYLVVRSGSFSRSRDALEREGIVGWNVSSTWFQRRVGLVHLTATTAAGRQRYTAYDIPVDAAVALAGAATPGLLEPFLEPVPAGDGGS